MYTEEDLKAYLTGQASMLSFKAEIVLGTVQEYYIMKQKISPLIQRLKGDASQTVKARLLDECRVTMMRFESLETFQNSTAFNAKVDTELCIYSPVLSALISNEQMDNSELFSFTGETILREARQNLPFWYKLPLTAWVLWLYALVCKKLGLYKQEKAGAASPKEAAEQQPGQRKDTATHRIGSQNAKDSEWKGKLRNAIKRISASLIPPGSTLQHELTLCEQQWNPLLNLPTHTRLTEDVNASIRDNVQRSLKSIKMTDFTHVRLRKMADALSSSPSLMKIENKEELNMYIQLYILRILDTI
jgi:hypothetical protein